MRKELLLSVLLLGICSFSLRAQTFETQFSSSGDSAHGNVVSVLNVHNDIRSTGSPVWLKWNVLDYSSNITVAGTQWGIDGLCDNVTCYSGSSQLLGGMVRPTDVYTSAFGNFYVIMNATNAQASSSAWIRVLVRDTTIGGSTRILTFVGNKSPAGILTSTVSEDPILMFPNPADKELHIKFPDDQAGSLKIVGADGRTIRSQAISNGSAVVPVEHLSKGVYFISFIDRFGRTIASRRFARN